MQKTNSGPEAKAEIDKQEALKKRAAKQAAKRELAPEVYPFVECTVLPMGDGKISMGEHVAGLGDGPLRGGRDLHRAAADRRRASTSAAS
jgi:hypothetical protein